MRTRRQKVYKRGFAVNGIVPLDKDAATEILKDIWDEHSSRKSSEEKNNGYETKNESAKNFLRREVYALARCLLKCPPTDWDVKELYLDLRGSTTQPKSLENIFHVLISSIYVDDGVSRQERSLIAQELEYAHRHKVPPKLLCGFLYQSTDRKKIHERLAEGFKEPAFRTS